MRPLEENFHILRVRVEEQTLLPALVVVSAAQRGDGTTYVACGLARAFAEAGHRTLLVDANTAHPGVARELGVRPIVPARSGELSARNGEIARLSVASLVPAGAPALAQTNLRELLDEMRAGFAVTVVDAAAIPASSTALQLAQAADGLILALQLGRRPGAADHELRRLIGGRDGRLVGVVPTRARAVRGEAPAAMPAAPVLDARRSPFAPTVEVGR